jgi:hypothetical protein
VVTQTLFGQPHFLFWVDFGQLARQPRPLFSLAQQVHGRLQRPAPVRVPALSDPAVEIGDGPLIQSDGDFLNHALSMTKYPTLAPWHIVDAKRADR